jgi:hypothetical protein
MGKGRSIKGYFDTVKVSMPWVGGVSVGGYFDTADRKPWYIEGYLDR